MDKMDECRARIIRNHEIARIIYPGLGVRTSNIQSCEERRGNLLAEINRSKIVVPSCIECERSYKFHTVILNVRE